MIEKKVLSDSEVAILEKIKTPLGIFLFEEKKLKSFIITDGLCLFFKQDRNSITKIVKSNFEDYIHKEDIEKLKIEITNIYDNPSKPFSIKYRFRYTKESEYIWLECKGYSDQNSANSHILYVTFYNNEFFNDYKNQYQNINTNNSYNTTKNSPFNVDLNIISLNKKMAQSNFFYWLYDIKKDLLYNGNIIKRKRTDSKFLENYPQVFFDRHVIHYEDIPRFKKMIEKALLGLDNIEDNIRILHPENNEYILEHVILQCIKDDNGKVIYIIGTAENLSTCGQVFNIITKLLAKNELITWNYILEEKVIAYNESEIKADELKSTSKIIYRALDNSKITIPKSILDGSVNYTYEVMDFTDEKGRNLKFEITHTLYKKNGAPFAIIGLARNVTEFYENERIYIDELEKANSNKSKFLSRLSHDMRTPLGAIFSISKFGIEESKDLVSINYFTKIRDNCEYLLSFINDVLESRKIINGSLVIQPSVFLPYNVIYQILSIIKLRADEKNINLVIETDGNTSNIYYYSDVSKIKQVAINLLNNAVKYTPRGGEVKLLISTEKEENHINVKCVISDNGVGMSKEFQSRMFDEFSQEHNSLSFEEEGSGVGLSIVKQIIDLFGATIECESELNKGTTFTINFKSDIATPKQIKEFRKKTDQTKLQYLAGKRVLICEDKDINIMIISKLLKEKNMILDTAINGLIGINKVKYNQYDVVLMDIRMPEIDGIEATKRIRKFNKNIPIIALSANASQEDIEKSIKAGMNNHISKPIDKIELYNAIYDQIIK